MIEIVKLTVGLVGGIGVSTMTRSAAAMLTPSNLNRFGTICVKTGTYLVSGIVASAVAVEANKQIDGAVEFGKHFKKTLKSKDWQ